MKSQKRNQWQLLSVLGLAILWGLGACSAGKNQNPVSGEETGKVSDEAVGAPNEKPTQYTAKSGDTLRKIAGRPEIYGDPNMWPILQEANADTVGQGLHVNKGVRLKIPRDISTEQVDEAHEKSRQVAAEAKMSSKPARKRSEPKEAPTAATAAPSSPPAPTAVPPMPVPQAKKSGVLLPVLFVLLLILAGLAVVLFFFMKKENKEENQD